MSPDNSLMVACGDVVVDVAMHNVGAMDDVAVAIGVAAVNDVVVVLGDAASVIVWV